MLRCIECGAESERGLDWEARIAYDPDDDDEPAEWLSFAPFAHSVNSGRSEHRGGPSAERPKQRNALIWLPRPGLWARRSCGDNRSRRSCGHAGTNL
jgi:hypothetical protein